MSQHFRLNLISLPQARNQAYNNRWPQGYPGVDIFSAFARLPLQLRGSCGSGTMLLRLSQLITIQLVGLSFSQQKTKQNKETIAQYWLVGLYIVCVRQNLPYCVLTNRRRGSPGPLNPQPYGTPFTRCHYEHWQLINDQQLPTRRWRTKFTWGWAEEMATHSNTLPLHWLIKVSLFKQQLSSASTAPELCNKSPHSPSTKPGAENHGLPDGCFKLLKHTQHAHTGSQTGNSETHAVGNHTRPSIFHVRAIERNARGKNARVVHAPTTSTITLPSLSSIQS